jgi:hypothetical protein
MWFENILTHTYEKILEFAAIENWHDSCRALRRLRLHCVR